MAELKMKQPLLQANNEQLSEHAQEMNAPVTPPRGPRKRYLKIGVPLYEASIKCDWKVAKDIFDNNPELVRYSITENGETALHIAASAKVPGKVKDFVKNLVNLMKEDDLALENANYNTALYSAATAGNVYTVEIMLEKNPRLLEILGGGSPGPPPKQPEMMPIYVAALFGNHSVVKYMYEKSNDLIGEHWTHQTRCWLLEKCVENNMFDVALKIVTKYPELETGRVLEVLARKPEAFHETESNFIQRTISWGINLYSKMNVTRQLSQNGNGSASGDLNQEQHSQNGNGSASRDLNQVQPSQNGNGSVPGDLDQEQPSQNGNGSAPGDLNQEAAIKCSTIGRTIKAGKRLYSCSIIGKAITSAKHCYSSSIFRRAVKPSEHLLSFMFSCTSTVYQFLRFKPVITYIVSKVVPPEINDEALQLLKLIWNAIAEKPRSEIDKIIRGQPAAGDMDQNTKKTYPSRILFVAAKMGNTRFVIELIRQYPDLIWKLDDKHRSIFHIAIKRRHEGIYNLLYEIGAMKDLITPIKDVRGNNMLHLVGKSASRKRRHQDVSGVALQMQRQLLWFKEVEAMIPTSYRDQKNDDGRTPYELFTKEHKELVKLGERWMKETANQCMVVAALIATIVFAAAFTVPGGYGQHNGKPIFQSKATFIVFVVADAISLFSSTTSILIFLSMLTSRYAERDFLVSLPKKLMAGLATLFLSITTMTVAFSLSFFVLYHKDVIWKPSLIAAFAVIPVLLYIRLQYALFFDVIRSTYGCRYLFKPRKHVLYYENPKV
ncbi:ankyrin repeat-containing domain, PGG domain protein [Artemisia annua]|uniref:Ankyrin repeat-containing domain, PGG domain protein n=1 Tax=Artemisia annua TaxID=35608 RepID=A0A2U1MR42_ARTAN|nr:ankyrin repeat-containing domain, PGG domain protein [Artemisia annua]